MRNFQPDFENNTKKADHNNRNMQEMPLNPHIHIKKIIGFQIKNFMDEKYEERERRCALTRDIEFDGNIDVRSSIYSIWMFPIKILQMGGDTTGTQRVVISTDNHFNFPCEIWNTREKAYIQYLKVRGQLILDDFTY